MQNKLNLLKSVQWCLFFFTFNCCSLFTLNRSQLLGRTPKGLAFQNASLWIRPLELDEELKVDEALLGAYSQSGVQGVNYHTTINILMEIGPGQVLGLGRIWRTRMFSDIWKPTFSRASRPQPPDQFKLIPHQQLQVGCWFLLVYLKVRLWTFCLF